MRSQCNQRLMGYGMAFDNYDDEEDERADVSYSRLGCRLPNEDKARWAEQSGPVKIMSILDIK